MKEAGGYQSDASRRLRAWYLAHGLNIRPLGATVYLMPPYCITDAELTRAYDGVTEGLDRLASGALAAQAVTVPSLAVLRSGQRDVVVVDLGNGRFSPREVTLGHEAGGHAEVLAGIDAGEMVVTSAQFLLDSEASLQEAIQKMISQQQQPDTGGWAAMDMAPPRPPDASSPEEHDHAQ